MTWHILIILCVIWLFSHFFFKINIINWRLNFTIKAESGGSGVMSLVSELFPAGQNAHSVRQFNWGGCEVSSKQQKIGNETFSSYMTFFPSKLNIWQRNDGALPVSKLEITQKEILMSFLLGGSYVAEAATKRVSLNFVLKVSGNKKKKERKKNHSLHILSDVLWLDVSFQKTRVQT